MGKTHVETKKGSRLLGLTELVRSLSNLEHAANTHDYDSYRTLLQSFRGYFAGTDTAYGRILNEVIGSYLHEEDVKRNSQPPLRRDALQVGCLGEAFRHGQQQLGALFQHLRMVSRDFGGRQATRMGTISNSRLDQT